MRLFHGPSPYADEPVLVATVDASAFGGLDPSQAEARLRADYEEWLDGCRLADAVDATHALALLAAHWARGLLRSAHGVIDAVGACSTLPGMADLWVGFHSPGVTADALRLAFAAVRQTGDETVEPTSPSFQRAIAAWALRAQADHPDFISRILMLAARSRGIPYARAAVGQRHWQFGWGRASCVFLQTSPDADSVLGHQVARDKTLTHQLLGRLGYPVTDQRVVDSPAKALEQAGLLGWPVVLKPARFGQGRGVSVDIRDAEGLAVAFDEARRASQRPLVIERMVQGHDHRLLVIRGRLVAATRREPPAVVGDGVHSVWQRVEQLNAERAAHPMTSRYLKQIKRETVDLAWLARQGLTLESVAQAGRCVSLRGNANVSTGGSVENVIDQVHPVVRAMAESVAVNLGLSVAGIDYITPDIRAPWREVGGRIIEVNTTPSLDLHIADGSFAEAQLGAAVLGDAVGRVPVVVIVCPTSRQRQLMEAIERDRRRLPEGLAVLASSGIRVGHVELGAGPLNLHEQVSRVMAHRECQAALIVAGNSEVRQHGFPIDRCRLVVWHADVDGQDDEWQQVARRCSDEFIHVGETSAWSMPTLCERVAAALTAPAGPG